MRILLPLCLMVLLAASCDLIQGNKLQGAVLNALSNDPRTSQYKFEVSDEGNGAIAITGEVYKQEEIDAVTEIAKAVPGVKEVMNRCHIEDTGGNGQIQDETVPLL